MPELRLERHGRLHQLPGFGRDGARRCVCMGEQTRTQPCNLAPKPTPVTAARRIPPQPTRRVPFALAAADPRHAAPPPASHRPLHMAPQLRACALPPPSAPRRRHPCVTPPQTSSKSWGTTRWDSPRTTTSASLTGPRGWPREAAPRRAATWRVKASAPCQRQSVEPVYTTQLYRREYAITLCPVCGGGGGSVDRM